MLLSTDSNGTDLIFSFANLGQAGLDRLVHCIDPDPGILLHVPVGQTGDQAIILLESRQDSTRLEIDDDGFRTLGTTIDADVEHTKKKTAIKQTSLTNPKVSR